MAENKEINDLVAAYVACRDSLKKHMKEAKDVEKAHKADLASLEAALMAKANELGVESFRTSSGTASKVHGFRISVRDWPSAIDYIIEHDLRNMLNKSISKLAAKEFMEENNNQLPPGLKYEGLVEIRVQRR